MTRAKRITSLTPEQRASLGPWAREWIANAMSTAPTTDAEWSRIVDAVHRMYALAGLPRPRVVRVPSPFVGAFAAGAAAWWWHGRGGAATYAATDDATARATRDATAAATDDATARATRDATAAATYDATAAATDDATRAATRDATDDATHAATHDATLDATARATLDATRAATHAATRDATLAATRDATDAATKARWYDAGACAHAAYAHGGIGALKCATRAWQMATGGNQWSGWAAHLSWWMRVARLDLTHGAALDRWEPYETLARLSGPRWMHAEFCLVSDRPETLTVDDRNRPHGESEPFCRWRDGTALWAWHGVYVPRYVVERPDLITLDAIDAEQNEEVRRVMVERYGVGRWLVDSHAVLVDADHETVPVGSAPRALLRAKDGALWLVCTDGSTGRAYHLPVPEGVETCRAAHEALCGFSESRIKVKS